MFYRPGIDPHGLAFNPFKALVSPRPIAWVSSLDANGAANLAPYSFFNAFADSPPMLAFGSGRKKLGTDEEKDSLSNIRATGEFVINVVGYDMIDAMNQSSVHYPAGEDEFERAGIEKAACQTVAAPRVAMAPASFECKLWKILELPGGENFMVIGEATGIHIRDDLPRDGKVFVEDYQPVARLGYRDFAKVETTFELNRPDD